MPIDALFLTAVTRELTDTLIGCRVDKVQQPERDTLLLSLRSPGTSCRLLLSASSNHPRIHLTEEAMENPAQPPMFCMLLRKHLTGGRIVSLTQPPMERLVDLCLDCTDEMGEPVQKHLVLELMGRNSNLILLGGDGRILDCMRRVDLKCPNSGRCCRVCSTISRPHKASSIRLQRSRKRSRCFCAMRQTKKSSTNGCSTPSAASRRSSAGS